MPKKEWGPGAWRSEPDRVEFEAHGFPALIVRQMKSGHLCGYVGVPPGHPWHGKGWSDGLDIDVHGGITYARKCEGDVCHIPKPGEPEDIWWLGFDCAHANDFRPADEAYMASLGIDAHAFGLGEYETYKDIAYVRSEIESLALQAKGAK